jgi:hypothetical protein
MDSKLGTLRCIGTNLRHEVSVFNTMLRREQNRRGLTFIKIGSYNSYAYNHLQAGNSLRALVSTLENRKVFRNTSIRSSKYLMIILGVNALRGYNGIFLQQITTILNKVYFAKLKDHIRIGYIHSSVGSMAFSFLGIQNYTSYQTKEHKSVITVNQPLYSKNFFK